MTWGKDCAPRARGPFEEEWPDLARGLDKALRARRVPAPRREDLIQDTGLRLFVRWSKLDPDRPLWPFALTIAMNLLKDEQRMLARRNTWGPPVEEIVERGVEEEALARLELTNVQIALQKLTPAQRSVLLADIGAGPYDDRGAAALKMLRMRARRTLRTVIDRASALLPVGLLKLKRASTSLGMTLQRNASGDHAQGIALSTLGIAGAVAILGAAWVGTASSPSGPGILGDQPTTAGTRQTAGSVAAKHPSTGLDRARAAYAAGASVAREHGLARDQRMGRHRHGQPAGVNVGAGGTGIDEEPSLSSDRFRVWLYAGAAAAGHEAVVDYEVVQRNPKCGSPIESEAATRTCIRPEAPTARGRAYVGAQGADHLGG